MRFKNISTADRRNSLEAVDKNFFMTHQQNTRCVRVVREFMREMLGLFYCRLIVHFKM